MAKKNKKAVAAGGRLIEQASRSKAGQIVLVRILAIVIVDVIVAMLFDFVGPHAAWDRASSFHEKVLPVLKIVFPALLLLAAVYLAVTLIRKTDTSAYWFTPAMLTAVALYLTVTVLFFDKFWVYPPLFYVMTVIVSLLFAVYYIYTILLYRK
ncbi:MAG: hypothetical protein II680_03850 [Clostridia bacterium]|nr:hypothetical protein [Clostridia bacterium]